MTPLMAGLATLGLITACHKDDDNDEKPEQGIFYGNTVNVGNGKARSFISHTDEHSRMELGIIMSAAALQGLSANEQEFELDLPKEAAGLTPFDHIALGWMSHGHPDPVYHHPHFDIHFYMISKAEQETISPDKPEMGLLPDPVFLPEQYINPDVTGVPKMGRHWVDATGPEFKPGGKFTTAFLMGTYNRKVVFWEPMITREYLATKPDTVMAIPQPKSFQQQGHYPTRYEIRFNQQKQEYRILLSGFEHR
ncbi:DUF5602 domain-containing protein [Chitinophaga sp. 22620]